MLNKIPRAVAFLKRYIKHPLYIFVYVYAFFLKDFSFKINFYKQGEIVTSLRQGKSLIRFGDGEINLLLGLKNHYHYFSPRLKKMMKEIVMSYSSKSPYVLSIPIFCNYSNKELKEIGKFNVWLPLKIVFFLIFPKNVSYMDAHNFYYDKYFENNIAPIFKDKIVICVTKKETIEKLKSRATLLKDVFYVETPEYNALKEYENIKMDIDEKLLNIKPEDVVLFFAMGPVGKYFIFEYANMGYQSIDIGKVAEVMFTGESIEYMI